MNYKNVTKAHNKLRALDHPIRKKIISLIMEYPGITVTDIWIKTRLDDQPTTSQHLAQLKREGYIYGIRHGKNIHYHVDSFEINRVAQTVSELAKMLQS